MTEPRLRLLLPLDGSPESESVLPALLPLFRSRKIRPTLFSVVPKGESSEPLQAYLGRLRTSLLLDGVASESRVEWGDPAEEILWLGKPVRFDLIAMTTHGRSGLRRALTGSVTEQVLRHAELPVIACRPGTRVGDWNRILVALDGSASSEAILPEAAQIAGTTGAHVHLLRSRSLMPLLSPYAGAPVEISAEDPEPYLQGMADRLACEGLLALAEPAEGDAAEAITKRAKELGAGLICLATQGRTGLSRLFLGSVAESVLRNAPCPVLLRRTVASAARPEPSTALKAEA